MGLKLMYITNKPSVAKIAENTGVDRVFVDLEYIGKSDRQGGMDTVQSKHTFDDIKNISDCLSKSQLLVRINPIHEATKNYCSSKEEIDIAIENGADILMLPYFKTVKEIEKFVSYVNGRVKVMPLVETPEAVECIDDILGLNALDEIYIGLNDLSLGYSKKFMFQLLADGTVDKLSEKFRNAGIPFGFGGIASLGKGMLPSEYIIKEHYRLNSSAAILSRSFCNIDAVKNTDEVLSIFSEGLKSIRGLEEECKSNIYDLDDNHRQVVRLVNSIVGE